VSENRIRPASEEYLDLLLVTQEWYEDARAEQRRRRIESVRQLPGQPLFEALERPQDRRFDQVQASNETGVLWPQLGQTQTWPRRTTIRPSSRVTSRSGPVRRSQFGMRLH